MVQTAYRVCLEIVMTKKEAIPEEQMILSIRELKDAGFSYYKINQLVEEGHLRKLNKRYYENLCYQGEKRPFYYIGAYTPEGVVCLRSAAAYYGLTAAMPEVVDVAIPRKARISTMPEYPPLSVSYYADSRYETAIKTVREGNNSFRIYDKEKTVLDIVSSRDKIGMEEAGNIVAAYLRQEDRALVPRHISRPKVCISHFCDFQFSRHIPVPTVCISHFSRF